MKPSDLPMNLKIKNEKSNNKGMSDFLTKWMAEEYEPRLVSVIIPTYNRAGLLSETLASVVRQTYRPLEIIVVDDGSIDDTKDVVINWSKIHNKDEKCRLRYFHQENKGGSAARNLGLNESHGQFIQFLDADDLLAPTKIERQVSQLSSSDSKTVVY